MTIGDALDAFEAEVVEPMAITPRTAYRRTVRLLRLQLGDRVVDPRDTLTADDLRTFVTWHRAHGLSDDAEGTRKAAVHVARLGAWLDLAVSRDELRALAPDGA